MDLTSPKIIKELLAKYETRPSKGLGQNFLIDKSVLNKIIETADLKPTDLVLEVGPGIGTLTQKLAENGGKIIAVEKDDTMIKILEKTLTGFKHVKIISGDILELDPVANDLKYKLVANIPYYLTSPLIRKFLEAKNKPDFMVLMVQKEVAQRICSKPPDMSLLSVSVQFYAEPKIISYVSKNCFWPAPKVDSAIIKITPFGAAQGRPDKKYDIPADLFFKVAKAGFSQPRKQLVNNLTGLESFDGVKLTKDFISDWLLKNNLKITQRAETLNISDWVNLAKSFQFEITNCDIKRLHGR